MLMLKCKESKLFARKDAEQTFIYSVSNPIPTRYDMMIAISKYGKKYAMLTPEDLTEKELMVFEFVLRDVDLDEEIVVFTKREYDAVKKYLYGKKIKVTLCD
jgi:hypothetical protein